jgi:hypothetical protein
MSERREAMDIVKDVKEVLELQNPNERERAAEKLSDVFEYVHDLSQEGICPLY